MPLTPDTSESRPSLPTAENKLLVWYQTSVAIIIAILWPLVATIVFLSLKEPLVSSIMELPVLIRGAQTITVGALSIDRRLKYAGIPEDTRRGLAKLSKASLVLLLHTGKNGFGYLDSDWGIKDLDANAVRELQRESLITVAKSEKHDKYAIRYSLTPSAQASYEIVLNSVLAQLAEDIKPSGK